MLLVWSGLGVTKSLCDLTILVRLTKTDPAIPHETRPRSVGVGPPGWVLRSSWQGHPPELQVSELELQKRGMMQKLLTGEARVSDRNEGK